MQCVGLLQQKSQGGVTAQEFYYHYDLEARLIHMSKANMAATALNSSYPPLRRRQSSSSHLSPSNTHVES